MEIKIGVADIVDKMSVQDLKDTFAQYLEQHADRDAVGALVYGVMREGQNYEKY